MYIFYNFIVVNPPEFPCFIYNESDQYLSATM